jgi:hypothetical protein
MTGEEHDTALQRLDAALREQDRLGDRYDAAMGTSSELSSYMRLRAAGDEVTARGRWLDWVESDQQLVARNGSEVPVEDLAAR